MKEFSRVFQATCAALLLQAATLPAWAQQHQEFSLPKTQDAEAITGQIDWPSGKLEKWTGPVVVIIPGPRAVDRDGWSLLAMGTTWQELSPYQELSSALVKNGFAVVRFESPEVMPPRMKCREAVRRGDISDVVIARQCLKMDMVQRAPLDVQITGTEYAAIQARKWMPGAKHKLVLLALGDDVLQAAAIIDRNKVAVHAFATIGGAANNAIETGQPVVQPSATMAPTPIPMGKALDEMQSPIDIMVRRRVPGLFMWGELSGRLSADLQTTFAEAANTTVGMQITRFRGCYHLLSKRSDEDWMPPYLVEQVANTIREFVDRQVQATKQGPSKRREQTAGGVPKIIVQRPAPTPRATPRSA